jgi:hypothetical protein
MLLGIPWLRYAKVTHDGVTMSLLFKAMEQSEQYYLTRN